MDWKMELSNIENSFGNRQKHNWQSDLRLIRHLMSIKKTDVEIIVRIIYLLHNILTEEDYSEPEQNELSVLLEKIFRKSVKRFSDNAEYQFFIGKILYVDEWLFGINDHKKRLEEKLAFQMQKRACELEPENLLFEWAMMVSGEKTGKTVTLTRELLQEDNQWNLWLRGKEFPGKYILESIKNYHAQCRQFRR